MRKVLEHIATKMHASSFWNPLYVFFKHYRIIPKVQAIFDYFEMLFPTEDMKITRALYQNNGEKLSYARSLLNDERSKFLTVLLRLE